MTYEHDESDRPEPRPAPLQDFLDSLKAGLPDPPPQTSFELVEKRQAELGPDASGRPAAICFRCGRTPEEIGDYDGLAGELRMTPTQYAWAEEGTLNETNGHFACDACYIAIGQPSAPGLRGWRAP